MNKDISIIVPVYNGTKTIRRLLASLISNSEYIHEIIIVDDYSDDNIEDFVYYFDNVKIVKSMGYRNPGLARKTGMLYATGKWITFIDADDCLTPSSLRYVHKNLDNSPLLLCCKTIYYESGNFTSSSIDYADLSCGGNFYDREFLIKNDIYPDDELTLVEDEYFNEKVFKYIELNNGQIDHFDYPVYEVHHDIEDGLSYALSNWVDYLCKYRLLYKQKIVDEFYGVYDTNTLQVEYIDNLIFCFYLAEGMLFDEEINFKFSENKKYFTDAINFYTDKFKEGYKSIIDYYNTYNDWAKELKQSASETVGYEFDDALSFEKFISSCIINI